MAASLFATRRTLASLISRRSRTSLPALLHSINNQSQQLVVDRFASQTRFCSTPPAYSALNDPSPNWSNRPPKETILLDGCDYEHWLIVKEYDSDSKPDDQEMVADYVKTLASVLGSEEEAKKKIYSVCTTTYTGFGALISEELANKVKALPGVLWVLPDSYLDVPNKDYGGDLFVDGKVIPRSHYKFNDRQTTRSRPRPRHDRRRETMQVTKGDPPQGKTSLPDEPGSGSALG